LFAVTIIVLAFFLFGLFVKENNAERKLKIERSEIIGILSDWLGVLVVTVDLIGRVLLLRSRVRFPLPRVIEISFSHTRVLTNPPPLALVTL
jgi:hypothetical protein